MSFDDGNDLKKIFDFFEKKYKESVGIMFGVVETDEIEMDIVRGEKSYPGSPLNVSWTHSWKVGWNTGVWRHVSSTMGIVKVPNVSFFVMRTPGVRPFTGRTLAQLLGA